MPNIRLNVLCGILILAAGAAALAAAGGRYRCNQFSFDGGTGEMVSGNFRSLAVFGQPAVPAGVESLSSPGFTSQAGSMHFTVLGDTEPPVITNLSLRGETESSRPRLAFRLEDAGSGIDTASIRLEIDTVIDTVTVVDGSNVSLYYRETGSGGGTLAYQPVQPLTAGPHDVTVRCSDTALNSAEPLTVGFDVVEEFSFRSLRCYPNPVRRAPVTFRYVLTGSVRRVELRLYDAAESLVTVLEGDADPDINEIEWDLTDDFGDEVANGAYLARVVAVSEQGETIDRYTRVAVLR